MLNYPKIAKAKEYQRKDGPVPVMAGRAKPKIARAFAAAFRRFRQSIDVIALADKIKTHPHGVADILDFDGFETALRPSFVAVADAYAAGGKFAASEISDALKKAGVRKDTTGSIEPSGSPYAFDLYTERVLSTLRQFQDTLIKELSQNSRDAVFRIVTEAARRGEPPEAIASDIRAAIGLTDRQMQAVSNFRRMLEDGDKAALTRDLRDQRYDSAVRRAIDAGETPSRIDEMVTAYADRYLDYRAETIARTESVRAVNLGLHDSYQQAVDNETFPKEAITRRWLVDLDERTCPICMAIPGLNPNGVAVDEDFVTPQGPIADPPIHPRCRCGVQYRTNIDMLSKRFCEAA